MKKLAIIAAILTVALTACSTQKRVTSSVNDDVYDSPGKGGKAVTTAVAAQPAGAQTVTSPDKANAQLPSSATMANDNNDYSYSSRINRFNSKDTTKGYFDEKYTGSDAGTGVGSSTPDVNFYLGSGPFGGYYNSWYSPYSSWGWDFGWGYPDYGWNWYYGFGYPHYYGWGYPYYGWYDPWYGPCYYCYGYNNWYNNEYYPYGTGGTYHGPRRHFARTDGGTGSLNARTVSNPDKSSGNLNERSRQNPAYSRTTAPSARNVPASQEKYQYRRSTRDLQKEYQRVSGRSQAQNQEPRQQPTPRYGRPENNAQAQRSGSVQNYSSPVYRQPKTSQEYLAPRNQNPQATGATRQSNNRYAPGNGNDNSRQYSTPSNTRMSTPTPRSNPSNYSAPSRSNSGFSTPSRSGSGSYSAPSGGGNNYSAPSRSGGSSGGSSSGSGSGRRR